MAKKIQNKDKKKAWDEFSRFVRVRDCLRTTGLPFVGVCITCDPPRRFHIKFLQAGHAIAGRRNALLLNPELTNAQCRYCNEYKHGEPQKYTKVMIARHGEEWWEKMQVEVKKIIQDKDMDFPGQAAKYKRKCEKLLREHGFKTFSEILQSE